MNQLEGPSSLTQQEAVARAALIEVRRYDIAVDLSGLLEGDTVESVSTISFTCAEPGASTFVDCVMDLRQATLNGIELDLSTAEAGRLLLPGLAADNVLVVAAGQSDTASSAGILRTVDPADKLVYVWTSFEADDARRLWACFDQPDLKAPHRFTVTAPDSWTVLSNCPPEQVEDAAPGSRIWYFPDTPPLSTYVVVVNAGPFHELRCEVGGYDLGLYSRQSTARYLDRDADELFDLTAQGLAFFGERFGLPFPQRRYDQVFVPNLGGAMENWGCVTWADDFLYRSPGTYGERSFRAEVLLHEMAHMWFGDLVTMRWWDDLWLNEAFASWAAAWACAGATEFTDIWASFLASFKIQGYAQDMGPASHPIRGSVPDVAEAFANFDRITYLKGQSVLRQLAAHAGEDAFVAGLRDYFRRHAWGNTRLVDLMSAVGAAAGTDLATWTTAWLDRAGTDTITHSGTELRVSSPDGEPPRPHTLLVGSYRADGDRLTLVGHTSVTTAGETTEISLPEADLHLLNDEDLTFAAARPEPASLRMLLDRGGELPTDIGRALAVATAWDMLAKGELAAAEFLTCVLGVLRTERAPGVVEPFLQLAVSAAERWTPPGLVDEQRRAVADAALGLAGYPELRRAALRAVAGAASTPDHFAAVEAAVGEDLDLAWRLLSRRAELGEHDEAAVLELRDRDPDPESATRALTVRAARPEASAKEEAFRAAFHERSVHAGDPMSQLGRNFWRPGQDEVLRPFEQRFLDEVGKLGSGALLELGSLVRAMFPPIASRDFVGAARTAATADGTPPIVRTELLDFTDLLARKLRARGE